MSIPGPGAKKEVVPLSDSQIVFLDQQWPDYEYPPERMQRYPRADEYILWEHVAVLKELPRETLEQAINALLLHHDGLRLRLVKQDGQWLQYIAAPGDPIPLVWVDLSHIAHEQLQQAVRATVSPELHSLNLAHGPVMKCVYIRQGGEIPGLLFVILNHVIADGFSMKILMEDLLTLLTQLYSGQKMMLPAPTTPFKTWAERIATCLYSPEWQPHLERLQAYKRSWSLPSSRVFPLDYPEGKPGALPFDKIHFTFSPQETSILLKQVTRAWNVFLNDVFQAALVKTVAPWAGLSALPIAIAQHGRVPIFEDIDLTRTIGAFKVELLDVLDFQEDLQPRLSPLNDPHLQFAQILSNFSRACERIYESGGQDTYLNFYDRYNPQLTLNILSFPIPHPSNQPREQRELFRLLARADLPGVDFWVPARCLDCFVWLEHTELQIIWQYSPEYFDYATILQVAQAFVNELRRFISPFLR